ncbi:MAG: Lrp/AsnC family transcriptional regulator [Bdellovibrionales bacterium]|nr:Lrp/AsnC family transcriptional regulator [Bdellovibrionales bacterium]
MQLKKRHYQLLWHLDQNAAMGLSDLAHRLGVSVQAVRYSIAQLEEAGIIKGFYAVVDFAALGLLQYRTHLRLREFSTTRQEEIIQLFCGIDSVFWVGIYLGEWDLQVSFLAENFIHLSWVLRSVQNEVLSACSRQTQSQTVYTYHFNRDYLVGVRRKIPTVNIHAPQSVGLEPDLLDLRLLRELAQNCRRSFSSLGEQFDTNPSTIRSRVRNLEKKGILARYRVNIDLGPLAIQRYKLKIFLENCTLEQEQEIYRYSTAHMEVVSMSQLLGEWQLDIDLEVTDRKQFLNFVQGLREKFSKVIRGLEVLEGLYCHKINYFPFKTWKGNSLVDSPPEKLLATG